MGGTYIRKGLKFSSYSLTKLTSHNEERWEKQIKLQTGNEMIHQSFTLYEWMWRIL